MSDLERDIRPLPERKSVLRNALEAIDSLQAKLDKIEHNLHEPIAIVGLSCRFPGAPNSEAYWTLLKEGRNAVTEVPADRWDKKAFYDPDPSAPGKMHAPYGGFLDQIGLFDAAFFGISGREADSLDPQQRLLLEVTWEALEDAGIASDQLRGSATGVFVGITTADYARQAATGDPAELDVYSATGGALNAAAGRLSFVLGLNGPAMAIDTACSSSLVSLHLACQSLRSRECNVSLAGGVNVLLSPEPFVCFAKWGMMAPDGRCKTFDEKADGFVRAEGCGMLVLKRLSDAEAAGDRVLALIRGTAVNQDGASSGLTVPNGLAQQAVIRTALQSANLKPEEVDYIEAHGTGTTLGDPIELEAIAAVLGKNRPADRSLYVGSVKTNIGHTESASGVAGLIKVVLSMQHGMIPPHINFQKLSPRISIGNSPIQIPVGSVSWPRSERPRIAGISSFGFSGTNAHTILQEAPSREPGAAVLPSLDRSVHLLVLSAKSEIALKDLATAYAHRVKDASSADLANICHAAAGGRTALSHRLAISVSEVPSALKLLKAAAAGEAQPGLIIGRSHSSRKVAFLFTGHQSQFFGMGRSFYETEPVFREAFDRCATVFDPIFEQPLRVISGYQTNSSSPTSHPLEDARHGQPVLFAFEYALACLWRSWGIEPAAVVGQDLGECVAACVAGVLSLQDALQLVAVNAQRVSRSSTEPISHQLAHLASTVTHHAPNIDLVLGATGTLLDDSARLNASYWLHHTNEPSLFNKSIRTLRERGITIFLEIGPAPTLISMGRQILSDPELFWLPSLNNGRNDWTDMVTSLGSLFVAGCNVDWRAFDRPYKRRSVDLPLYPFQRKYFWLNRGAKPPLIWTAIDEGSQTHPLLGHRRSSPLAESQFACTIDVNRWPVLNQHRVAGLILFPAAGFIELGCAAAREVFAVTSARIEQGWLRAALVLDSEFKTEVQLVVTPENETTSKFEVFSRSSSGEANAPWTSHAGGRLIRGGHDDSWRPESIELARARCTESANMDLYQERMAEVGLDYGPSFRALVTASRGDQESFGELRLPANDTFSERLSVHPGLLDAAFHLIGVALGEKAADLFYLPVGYEAAEILTVVGTEARAHVHLRVNEPARVLADITIWQMDGNPALRVRGLEVRPVTREQFRDLLGTSSGFELLKIGWRACTTSKVIADAENLSWQVIGGDEKLAASIVQQFNSRGIPVTRTDVGRTGANGRLRGIIDLRAIELPNSSGTPPSEVFVNSGGWKIVEELRSISLTPPPRSFRFVVTTLRSQAVFPTDPVDPLGAALWGLGATASLELPAVDLRLIDLEDTAEVAPAIVEAALRDDDETRLAIRSNSLFAPRLIPTHVSNPEVLDVPTGRYELIMNKRGTLAGLGMKTCVRNQPRSGCVEIEVLASGLNFRDVLNLLDMYPGPVGALGNECSGRIVALGAGVSRHAVGDLVSCIAEATFASHVVAPAELIFPVPPELSMAQAAVFPIAQLTAYLALHQAGRIQPGDYVLIHAGAGGVGLAAVHLALAAGAVVFATAGADDKRQYLRDIGVREVFDSRQVLTASVVQATTQGHGIDLLLNSLTGEFIDEGLRALAPGGRFLEIGLRELRTVEQVRAIRDDVTYYPLLLGEYCRSDPAFIRTMYDELVRLVRAGRIPAPRVRTFPIGRAEAAFRHMAKARHIGRIAILHPATEQSRVRADASYVVTGGMGAIGLHMANWLADQGARHLVLIGRNDPAKAATERIAALRSRGVKVELAKADVANLADLAFLSKKDRPPIRGIMHVAGITDDAILANVAKAQVSRNLRPKADGACNLIRVMAEIDLDLLIFFSSGSAILGSPGQAMYAASNSYLDALACGLHSSGISAVSINWGAWKQGGMATQVAERTASDWARRGVGALSVVKAGQLLKKALASGLPQVAALGIDWSIFFATLSSGRVSPFLSELKPNIAPNSADSSKLNTSSAQENLLILPPTERAKALTERLAQIVAAVLRVSNPTELDLNTSLTELGMDSLIAMEIASQIKGDLGVTISMTRIIRGPSLVELSSELALLIASETPPTAIPFNTGEATRLLDQLPDLADEEVDLLLKKLMEEKKS